MQAPNLHTALRRLGYGNRAYSDKGREIYRLKDGTIVGVMHAYEAWTFVHTHSLGGY